MYTCYMYIYILYIYMHSITAAEATDLFPGQGQHVAIALVQCVFCCRLVLGLADDMAGVGSGGHARWRRQASLRVN